MRNASRECFLDSDVIYPEQQKKWFERYLNKDDDYMFAIEDGGVVGFFALYNNDDRKNAYEFGRFLIDRSASGRGLGKLTLAIASAIGFAALNADAIKLEVLKCNERALHVYEDVGFEETDVEEPDDDLVVMRIEKDALLERWGNVYSSIEAQVQD